MKKNRSISKITDPFELEIIRSKLAKNRKYSELKKTYNSEYAEIANKNSGHFWDRLNTRGVMDSKINPMAYHRLNLVADMINRGSTVLDVGFGSANLEYVLNKSSKNFKLFGIDISSKSVKSAQKRFPQWKFLKSTITEMAFSNQFDYVVCLEVLEHVSPSNIFNSIKKLHLALKIDGTLIISVPMNEGLREMVIEGKNPNAHTRIYSESLIKAELEMSGFTIKRTKHLYAFHSNYYLKSTLAKIIKGREKANNVIIIATKS